MFLNRLVERLRGRAAGAPRERVMSDDFERRLLREELPSAYFSDRFQR
jgi:hypothetical protein